jgi:hypothetical protein
MRALAGCALLGALGCAGLARAPDFSLLYTPAARHHGADRNPIIAIPGILGSKLPDTHLGLTRSDVFRDNVLFWLLEEPRQH